MNKFQKWMDANGDNQKNVMRNFYEVAGKLIDSQTVDAGTAGPV